MGLGLELSQKQNISQRMIQSVKILQMNSLELQEYLSEAALDNPVIDFEFGLEVPSIAEESLQRRLDWLEEGDYQNKAYYQQDRDGLLFEQNSDERCSGETLIDVLQEQVTLLPLTELEKAVLEFLILSLDQNGYLTEPLSFFTECFKITTEEAERILALLQSFEPAGVGARSLEECLLLQLQRKKKAVPLMQELIRNHLSALAKNHLSVIASKLSISVENVQHAFEAIRKLNPFPGAGYTTREYTQYIIPDAEILQQGERLEILLRTQSRGWIHIDPYYASLAEETNDRETKKYLKGKLQEAKQLKEFVEQRAVSLSRVLKILTERQQAFFLFGPGNKHPLKLAEIAEEMGVHESTVSRILKGKYLQCRWGIFSLRSFLTASLQEKASFNGSQKQGVVSEEGKMAETQEQILKILQQMIEEEDKTHPLSDQKICDLLQKKWNISISRRTVNKYRGLLGIPDKSGRHLV